MPEEPLGTPPSAPVMDAHVDVSLPVTCGISENFAKQQRRLELWEQELQRRERALVLRRSWTEERKNWPWGCPIIYHDIDTVIPIHHQPLIRSAYRMWKTVVAGFLFNWWFMKLVSFLDWCLCSFASGCGIPLSFVLYYYPLYRAAEKDRCLGAGYWHLHIFCAMLWSLLTFSGHITAGIWSVWHFLHQEQDLLGLASFANALLWFTLFIQQSLIWRDVRHPTLPASHAFA